MIKEVTFMIIGGLVVGSIFAKTVYHKGKLDAYNECAELFNTFRSDVENMVTEEEEIEEKS